MRKRTRIKQTNKQTNHSRTAHQLKVFGCGNLCWMEKTLKIEAFCTTANWITRQISHSDTHFFLINWKWAIIKGFGWEQTRQIQLKTVSPQCNTMVLLTMLFKEVKIVYTLSDWWFGFWFNVLDKTKWLMCFFFAAYH